MAKEASMSLLFLSFFIFCCSGTLVGFSYGVREDTESPTSDGPTILQRNKISQPRIRFLVTDHKSLNTLTNYDVPVDFFLNETSKSFGVSRLKAHLVSFLPQVVEIRRSIIISCGSECLGQNELPLLLSALRSIHCALTNLQMNREVKVSVGFPLSFLEKLNASYENDIHMILRFIKNINSFVMIEDRIDGELSMGDHHFVRHVIKRATVAASILPCEDVPLVLTIKGKVIPSSKDLPQFNDVVSKYLEAATSQITKRIVALYAEVHTTEGVAYKELKREEEETFFPLSQREKLSRVHIRRTLDETNYSPTTVFPTNPTSATPAAITPPNTPAIITVPSTTSPVTVSPTNPTVPSSTPVPPLAPTNPANSSPPLITPPTTTVPGAQPITNPAASYPPPSGSVPVTNPSLPPPAGTNAPATSQGQSWCVAKNGVPETTLQSALDYACGMKSVDCSQIQQGGSCYNPNSIQNHASFAFNSYFQKNPAPTSCDFGGAATIVNTNPSSGSCVYPSSSSAAADTSGSGATPSAFGPQSPSPNVDTSHSAALRPLLGFMGLVISLITGRLSI